MKRYARLVTFLLLIVTAFIHAQEPVRAVQFHVMPGATITEFNLEMEKVVAAGFNSVIVRVFQNEGDRFHAIAAESTQMTGVYFKTDVAPTVADLLTPLAIACKKNNLQLIAWITAREMDWLKMDSARDIRFDANSKQFVYSDKFDLLNDEFEKYLTTLYKDLSAQPIDGIILQDDFSILTREGFTDSALRKFYLIEGQYLQRGDLINSDQTEIDTKGKLFQQWAVFKSYQLQELGNRIQRICRAQKKNLKLGLNVYYDAVVSREQGMAWLGQDIDALEHNSFDHIYLMAYHKQYADENGVSDEDSIVAMQKLKHKLQSIVGDRLVTKIQLKSWRNGAGLVTEEVSALQQMISGSDGVAMTPFDNSKNLTEQLLLPKALLQQQR